MPELMFRDVSFVNLVGMILSLSFLATVIFIVLDIIHAIMISFYRDVKDWCRKLIKRWRESRPHRGWQPGRRWFGFRR